MSAMLEGLQREEPAALEEAGHRWLPVAQVCLLAHGLDLRAPSQTVKVFVEEVKAAARTATDERALGAELVRRFRQLAAELPLGTPVGAQADALAKLARLRSMPASEREWVMGRFVERLSAQRLAEDFGVEVAALRPVLARGAALLVGPPPAGGDWEGEASLVDPDAPPAAPFIELENLLSSLAIDVTALELQPLKAPAPAAPVEPADERGTEAAGRAAQPSPFVEPPADPTAIALPPAAAPLLTAAPTAGEPTSPARGKAPVPWADESSGNLPLQAESARTLVPLMDEEEPTEGSTTRPMVALADPEQTPHLVQALRRDTPASLEVVTAPVAKPLPRSMAMVKFLALLQGGRWWGAGVASVLIAVGLYAWGIGRVDARQRRDFPLTQVLVAARDLTEGEVLTVEMLAARRMPEDVAGTSSVVRPEAIDKVLGQVLLVAVKAGEPLLWTAAELPLHQQRLARKVGKQRRAYTIAVTELRGAGGWLKTRETVDLVLTVEDTRQKGKHEVVARTLLQYVQLLAVGKTMTLTVGTKHLRYTHLSLLLTAEEAEALALASNLGSLTATVRSDEAGTTDLVEPGSYANRNTLLEGERRFALEKRRFELFPRPVKKDP